MVLCAHFIPSSCLSLLPSFSSVSWSSSQHLRPAVFPPWILTALPTLSLTHPSTLKSDNFSKKYTSPVRNPSRRGCGGTTLLFMRLPWSFHFRHDGSLMRGWVTGRVCRSRHIHTDSCSPANQANHFCFSPSLSKVFAHWPIPGTTSCTTVLTNASDSPHF